MGLTHSSALSGLILMGTGAKLSVSPTILNTLETDYEKGVALLNHLYWGNNQNAELVEASRQQMLATPANVTLGDFLACDQFDLRQKLANITLPTLVISGTTDRMTPPKFGKFLAAHIPQTQYVEIERGGHMMGLEFPKQVAQLLSNFLKKIDAG